MAHFLPFTKQKHKRLPIVFYILFDSMCAVTSAPPKRRKIFHFCQKQLPRQKNFKEPLLHPQKVPFLVVFFPCLSPRYPAIYCMFSPNTFLLQENSREIGNGRRGIFDVRRNGDSGRHGKREWCAFIIHMLESLFHSLTSALYHCI